MANYPNSIKLTAMGAGGVTRKDLKSVGLQHHRKQ